MMIGLLGSMFGEITPFKYDEIKPEYEVPEDSRFVVKRSFKRDVVYYLSKPEKASYPIAVLIDGSSSIGSVSSVIHFHRYFLQECLDLGMGALSVESLGVDGQKIDEKKWRYHYKRSGRVLWNKKAIEALKKNPPAGWNGKLVFIAVSEGGAIANELAAKYKNETLAVVNLCGASGKRWIEHVWNFVQKLDREDVLCSHKFIIRDCNRCKDILNRGWLNFIMGSIRWENSPYENFLGMSGVYHADAMGFPLPKYKKLTMPYLAVAGELDHDIECSDLFVEKAKEAGMDITYFRVEGMDHYIRKRPDILEQTFEWLGERVKD